MTVRTPGAEAMTARRPRSIRRSTLALALALATGTAASPAFALGCKYDRTGDSVTLSRNALEPDGSNSYYGYGSSQPSVAFDATGLDRVELNGCRVDEIAHGVLVTDRPIELVINNGRIPIGTTAGPHDTFIDLSNRFVNAVAGSSAHNRIVVNGGPVLSTRGTDGPVPLDVIFNGGAFLGFSFTFDPNGRIRDGDTLTVNGGTLQNTFNLGGGADTATFAGGDAGSAFILYGDGGTFRAADLNTFGNRFDDTFVFTGGRVDTVHGDSGDTEAARDASGRYTQDGGPAGDDHFILDGGWVRTLAGDDGDDRLDLKGASSLLEFRGGYGSDTVDVAAGASLDHVYTFIGDARYPYGNDAFLDRSTDVDVIRFHGQQFEAASDSDAGCNSGAAACRKHVDVRGFERIELLDGARLTIHDRGGMDGAAFGEDSSTTTVRVDATSTLAARRSTSTYEPYPRLRASLVNDGTVDLGQDAAGDLLWVGGDWSGAGRVLMSTVFGDDASVTDGLRIDGNASGRTVLDIVQAAGSTGAQTRDGILVVDTRGTSTSDAFVLAAPITTANGLWQYRLEKASSGANAGKFVLTSSVPAKDPPVPPPTTPGGGTPPPPTTTPGTGAPTDGNARLLAPVVATVAGTGMAAQSLVVDGLADADARLGASREAADAPLWIRARGDRLRTHGDRFGQDLRRIGMQVGIDLQRDEHATRGVMLRVAQADGEIVDRLRPTIAGFATALSGDVGDVRVRAYTVGAYQTLALGGGVSLDLSGEGGKLQARMSPDDGRTVRTGGWASALSATASRAFASGGWSWAPQAQLVAAHTSLGGLDGSVDSRRLTQNALRARGGLRLSSADAATTRVYGVANLWRDLRRANDVVFHGGGDATSVRPSTARSWAELGVGLTHERGASSWYVDLRGERGIGAGGRNAVSAQAGLDLRW